MNAVQLGSEIRKGFSDDLEREASRKIIRAIDKWRKGGRIKTAQRRWLFELIQNALDISKDRRTTLEIEVVAGESNITFRHNAGFFTDQEIRALIYAYSTKPYDRESEYAGLFATGFLVTHITSRVVNVKSTLRRNGEYYEFEACIDRASENIGEIHQAFSRSFDDLNNANRVEAEPMVFWTEYKYEIADDVGKEAVSTGISEVKKCLPFIFAFSKIQRISLNGEEFVREKITIGDLAAEKVGSDRILIGKTEDVEIAIPLKSGLIEIASSSELPKLYVKGLPLTETADYLRIPFVINSPRFSTTEDRNTLEDIEENEKILKKALMLYFQLIEQICELPEARGLHYLSDFRLVSETIVIENPLWLRLNDLLKIYIKNIAEKCSLVDTFTGREAISNIVFPSRIFKGVELKSDDFNRFYNILKEMSKPIPTGDALKSWIETAHNIRDEFRELNVTIYDIDRLKNELVQFVESEAKSGKWPSLSSFGQKFSLTDPKRFLLLFLELANGLYRQEIIESPSFIDNLMLDQAGFVGPYHWNEENLRIDKDLPKNFKDILERIGWKIRQELANKDFAVYKIVRDLIHDIAEVHSTLERAIRDHPPSDEDISEEPWKDKVKGWIDLFRWCAQNNNFEKGFPVITKARKLRLIEDLTEETVIIPFVHMNIKEEFEDIYPESRILHLQYFDVKNPTRLIKHLENYDAFVTHLPIYKSRSTFSWNKLKSVTENAEVSKIDHQIEAPARSISVLPCWNEVIGRISDYEKRAESLLLFVALHLVEDDNKWRDYQEVQCDCKQGTHIVIPSHWLASLKTDNWVPSKISENGEEKMIKVTATKESIEKLLVTISLEDLLGSNPDKITQLLTHLGFDELDLKIKLQSIEREESEEQVRKDVSVLVDIASLIPDLPDLAKRDTEAFKEAITKLRDSYKRRELANENREIGENLEVLTTKILSGLEGIRKITSIYKGGDLELWPEPSEGWDSGLIEIKPYLIEVKFTSGNRVHLSKAQGELANAVKSHYVLLIVGSAPELRDQLLSLRNSQNDNQEELAAMIIEKSTIVEHIHKKLGSFPNPEEIEPDIHGYWVKRKLWHDKVNILSWVEQKFSN